MISFDVCPVEWQAGIFVMMIISIWVLLFVGIYEIAERKGYMWFAVDTILFFGSIIFYVTLEAQYRMTREHIMDVGIKIPIWLPVVTGVSGIAYGLIRMAVIRKKNRHTLSKHAIQESLENLPSGIGFFDWHGIPKMINRQMYRLGHFLSGKDIQSVDELREALRTPSGEVVVLDSANGLYQFPDGRVWKFSEMDLEMENGEIYTQFLATDVSKLYENRKILEEENRRMNEAARSMKELSRNILAITREEETLALKMRVHDDLGHSVLWTHRLLTQESTEEDKELLLKQWGKVLRLLRCDHQKQEPGGQMDKLKERAALLGLKLCVTGSFPAEGRSTTLISMAIQECMTNCVRHAQATRLNIEIRNQKSKTTVIITNNGKKPEGKVSEGGGLSGLRRQLENYGGSMVVCAHPIFSLVIVIPDKEEGL